MQRTQKTAELRRRRDAKQANRRKRDAKQVKARQYREEAFTIRADLLERTARCAANLYVICRHVEALQKSRGLDTVRPWSRWRSPRAANARRAALGRVSKLLDGKYLEFVAEGLTLQTEIEARFKKRTLQIDASRTATRKTGEPVEEGESSLRWHQVYDLLTIYYFRLTRARSPTTRS